MARSVTDRHGIVWNVEEVPRASGRRRPAAGVARWLSCVSAGAWRQLRDFPADWRELPEPELASSSSVRSAPTAATSGRATRSASTTREHYPLALVEPTCWL